MIDLYYWTTPNGHKITIFLEETGLPYAIRTVNISKGEQFDTEVLEITPNNRIPAIVDHAPADGGAPLSVFESGAILMYLGQKTGRFVPTDFRARVQCVEWLFWQMGGLGPMAGQNHHFNLYAPERIPYAIERYTKETGRLYGVLNKRLATREFIAGDYSIADMACYPWILPERQGQEHGATFRTSRAGRRRFRRARRCSAPTRWRSRSTRSRPSPTPRRGGCFSGRTRTPSASRLFALAPRSLAAAAGGAPRRAPSPCRAVNRETDVASSVHDGRRQRPSAA